MLQRQRVFLVDVDNALLDSPFLFTDLEVTP